MTVIGFNFNEIHVEKKEGVSGKVNIKNNVSIEDVKEHGLDFGGGDQKAVRFVFKFVSSFEPGLGSIILGGDLVFIGKKDKIKTIVDDWKKSKKVEKEVMANILNTVLTKCNIEALIISQKVNLPPPIPMPKVKEAESKDQK